MKYSLVLLLGFILAQGAEYTSNKIVDVMQNKCYHLWTESKQDEYQICMDDQKTLSAISDVVGFNFVYSGRKILFGY